MIYIWDDDIVGPHNQPASFYGLSDVGKPKVLALEQNIHALNGVPVVPHQERYINKTISTPVVVVAVDTLRERRRIWNIIKQLYAPPVDLIIDVRTGKEIVQVYTCLTQDSERVSYYENSLQHVEGVTLNNLACSEKAVAFNSSTVTGLAVGIYASYVRGTTIPARIDVDHKTWGMSVKRM